MPDQQQEIDFRLSELRSLLRGADIPSVRTYDGWVSAAQITGVLRVIFDHAGGGECWLKHETIAREARCSLRQAKRASQALRELSLITVEKKKTPRGPVCNHYRVVWTELALRCNPRAASNPAPDQSGSNRADQSATTADQSATTADQSATTADQSANPGTFMKSKKKSKTKLPPPTPSSADGCASAASVLKSPTWEEVEALVAEHCVDWAACCRDARRRVDPDHALRIVQQFRKLSATGIYGPGALHRRLCLARPERPPETGWPNAQPQQRDRVTEDAVELQRAPPLKQHDAAQRQKARERQAAAERESLYGAELDGLSPADLASLIAEVFSPEERHFLRSELRPPVHESRVREPLLEAISAKLKTEG